MAAGKEFREKVTSLSLDQLQELLVALKARLKSFQSELEEAPRWDTNARGYYEEGVERTRDRIKLVNDAIDLLSASTQGRRKLPKPGALAAAIEQADSDEVAEKRRRMPRKVGTGPLEQERSERGGGGSARAYGNDTYTPPGRMIDEDEEPAHLTSPPQLVIPGLEGLASLGGLPQMLAEALSMKSGGSCGCGGAPAPAPECLLDIADTQGIATVVVNLAAGATGFTATFSPVGTDWRPGPRGYLLTARASLNPGYRLTSGTFKATAITVPGGSLDTSYFSVNLNGAAPNYRPRPVVLSHNTGNGGCVSLCKPGYKTEDEMRRSMTMSNGDQLTATFLFDGALTAALTVVLVLHGQSAAFEVVGARVPGCAV
jgi:hypothetical protein